MNTKLKIVLFPAGSITDTTRTEEAARKVVMEHLREAFPVLSKSADVNGSDMHGRPAVTLEGSYASYLKLARMSLGKPKTGSRYAPIDWKNAAPWVVQCFPHPVEDTIQKGNVNANKS